MEGIYDILIEQLDTSNFSTLFEMDAYTDLYAEAKRDVLKQKMKKLVNLQFKMGTLGKVENAIKEKIKNLEEQLKENTAEEHSNKFMFFTINPKPSVTLEDFLKVVAKSVTKTCFLDYFYVIEQRGHNSVTAGKGYHAHILVKRNLKYKPIKCRQNMSQTFSKMCDVKNPALFNVKYLNTEWANDKISYMTTGGKTGNGKDVKQDIDIWWREKLNIEPYYGNPQITQKSLN